MHPRLHALGRFGLPAWALIVALAPALCAQRLRFADPLPVSFGTGQFTPEVCDVDLDGRLDLVAAGGFANAFWIRVSINDGSGRFRLGATVDAGQNLRTIVCGDLNGDGYPDMAVTNSRPYNTISVVLNQGVANPGKFHPPVAYAIGEKPLSMTIGDLNGDNHLDLVAANSLDDDVSVLINRGDGSFEPQVRYRVGGNPLGIQAVDLDQDSHLDLATANRLTNDVSVLFNQGDGTFAGRSDHAVGDEPRDITGSDLNGDGKQDLITVNCREAAGVPGDVSVLLNLGGANFAAPIALDPLGCPSYIKTADFDCDGSQDLLVGNQAPGNVVLFLNDGAAGFDAPIAMGESLTPWRAVAGDLDGDRDLDVAVSNKIGGGGTILQVGPSSVRIKAGIEDLGGSALPSTIEFARPRAALEQYVVVQSGVAPRAFDVDGTGAWFAHSFEALPKNVVAARLEWRATSHDTLAEDDEIALAFDESRSSFDWQRELRELPEAHGSWKAGESANFSLDLDALPISGGALSLLEGLRREGRLDVVVRNDTELDYLRLELTVCRPFVLDLQQGPLVRGHTTNFEVRGGQPGEIVWLGYSRRGVGDGSCLTKLGGLCIALIDPYVRFASAVVKPDGVARFDLALPVQAPLGLLTTQATIRRGAAFTESELTNPVTAPVFD